MSFTIPESLGSKLNEEISYWLNFPNCSVSTISKTHLMYLLKFSYFLMNFSLKLLSKFEARAGSFIAK